MEEEYVEEETRTFSERIVTKRHDYGGRDDYSSRRGMFSVHHHFTAYFDGRGLMLLSFNMSSLPQPRSMHCSNRVAPLDKNTNNQR